MSDTPQLPSKRLKSEEVVVASSSPAHMSHGSNYLSPTHFQHAYTAYTSAPPPPPPPFNHPQPTYSYQPLQLVQQPEQHHYQPLSLGSHYGNPLNSGLSRKRTASEMDTPPMGAGLGLPTMSYGGGAGSSLLHGATSHSSSSQLDHSSMLLGGHGEPSRMSMHLGPGSVQDVVSGVAMQGPKKGRTNTPWTRDEEMRLKHMRDAGNSWSEIAKEFPNRTEGSVKKHWYKDMHYTEISEDEGTFKAALISAIKEYDANKWKIIGQKMGKPAKACEQFAREHLGKT